MLQSGSKLDRIMRGNRYSHPISFATADFVLIHSFSVLWKFPHQWHEETTIYGFHSITQYQRPSTRTSSSTWERILCYALLPSLPLCVCFPWVIILLLDQWLCLLNKNSNPLDWLCHLMSGDDLSTSFVLCWMQEDWWRRQRSITMSSIYWVQGMRSDFRPGGN